eukprot:4800216-Pyramimonas_sp.AAC.1
MELPNITSYDDQRVGGLLFADLFSDRCVQLPMISRASWFLRMANCISDRVESRTGPWTSKTIVDKAWMGHRN